MVVRDSSPGATSLSLSVHQCFFDQLGVHIYLAGQQWGFGLGRRRPIFWRCREEKELHINILEMKKVVLALNTSLCTVVENK